MDHRSIKGVLKRLSEGVHSNTPNPIIVDGTVLQNAARFVDLPKQQHQLLCLGTEPRDPTGWWCGPDVFFILFHKEPQITLEPDPYPCQHSEWLSMSESPY